jgi:hypothetical protein
MIILLTLVLYSQVEIPLEMKQLQQEIKIINLLNGLELLSYQMTYILEKVQEAEKIRNEFHQEITKNADDFTETLSQLKEHRLTNKDISAKLGQNIHILNTHAQSSKAQYLESLDRISHDVETILDGHQLYQLEHYSPCLIPPPGETKIGQSDIPTGVIKQLQKLREIPDWLYDVKKNDIAEKTIEKLMRHRNRYSEFSEDEEKTRILDLFDEIRSVPDIEFALNKQSYAEELKAWGRPAKPGIALSSKIKMFLLDPLIVPILNEMLKTTQAQADIID